MDSYKNTKKMACAIVWTTAITIPYVIFCPYNEWWGITITILYCAFAFIVPILILLEDSTPKEKR